MFAATEPVRPKGRMRTDHESVSQPVPARILFSAFKLARGHGKAAGPNYRAAMEYLISRMFTSLWFLIMLRLVKKILSFMDLFM